MTTANPPGRPPKDRLLALPALLAVVSLGRSHLYDLMARGEFPRPVKVGRSALWRLSEVEAWMAGLQALPFHTTNFAPHARRRGAERPDAS